jgi:hypothetical protein
LHTRGGALTSAALRRQRRGLSSSVDRADVATGAGTASWSKQRCKSRCTRLHLRGSSSGLAQGRPGPGPPTAVQGTRLCAPPLRSGRGSMLPRLGWADTSPPAAEYVSRASRVRVQGSFLRCKSRAVNRVCRSRRHPSSPVFADDTVCRAPRCGWVGVQVV